MYEIRDNQVVKVTEGVIPTSSKEMEENINNLKLAIEDQTRQVEVLVAELEIIKKLESELK